MTVCRLKRETLLSTFDGVKATVATMDRRAATPTVRDARSGHHGPPSSHADSNEPSSSKHAPPGYPTALSECTNQDGHALLRHSPVFPRHRWQYHLNPSDINKQHVHELTNLKAGRGVILAACPGRTFLTADWNRCGRT
jgi:hypothetical protein